MKNFIKILILVCLAHFMPTIAMEQAEETPNQSAILAEDILPNELWAMILFQVYLDENICIQQNIFKTLDSIKQKLPNISKNISLVCKAFNFLNKSISTSSSSKNELKEFYRFFLIRKFQDILTHRDLGKFIRTRRDDDGIISQVLSYHSKYFAAGLPLHKVIALLLFYGANVNSKDKHDYNTVHKAVSIAEYGLTLDGGKLITILLAQGADVDAQTPGGQTALHLAVCMNLIYNSIGIIKILLDYGADVNIQNHNGDTALHRAISHHATAIQNPEFKCNMIYRIKLLLDHGANLTIANNDGDTPTALAERSSSDELKKLLSAANKNVNKSA